jgi:nucleotide-binding universal stress UspA family protein
MRTILVALDGSPRQPHVLDAAVGFARAFGGSLHLVRAMAIPVGLPAVVWAVQGADLGEALILHAQRDLDAVVEQLRAASPAVAVARTHTRIGQPADVIVDIAKEIAADLVVVGSHSYDTVERWLGTTAAKVVDRAPCSVVVIRPPASEPGGA